MTLYKRPDSDVWWYDLTVLLLDTGARYNEAATLSRDQIDLEGGRINLYRSKVGNESWLTMTKRVKEILTRRMEATWPRKYIFPAMDPCGRGRHKWTRQDKPRGHATDAIQNAIDTAGLNRDLSLGRATPHTFRDTFASRLVQAGVTLVKVSHLLGHSDVKMTQKYAHLCPDNTGREAAAVLDGLHSIKSAQGDDPMPVAPEAAAID